MTIEVRRDDDGIDEVVAFNAYVHLERMDDASWHLVIETSLRFKVAEDDRRDFSLAAFDKPLRLEVVEQ